MNNNIHQQISGKARIGILEQGRIQWKTGFIDNIILNQGMDAVAVVPFAEAFVCCAVGDGTAETRKKSNAVANGLTSGYGYDAGVDGKLASRSLGTVTFSGGSGDAIATSDVGNIISIVNDGTYRIASRTNGNECQVLTLSGQAPAGSSTSNNFTIFLTNQVELEDEVLRAGTQTGLGLPSSPDGVGDGFFDPGCSTVLSGSTVQMTRSWIFKPVIDNVVVRELGFSWSYRKRTRTLFSRIRLTEGTGGTSFTLLAGQQLIVSYQLSVTVSPTSPVSTSLVGFSNNDGLFQLELSGMSKVAANGQTGYIDAALHGNEPYFRNQKSVYGLPSSYTDMQIFASTSQTPHPTFGSEADRSAGRVTKTVFKPFQYAKVEPASAFGYFVERECAFGESDANIAIGSMGFAVDGKNASSFIFNSAQTKTSSYTVRLKQTISWSRTLI